MTRHVGAEALARYREGDLGGRRSSRIRAHLARCARCAALDEELAGVSAILASVPGPAMPEQVTTRITAALMAARQAQPNAGLEPGRPELPRQSRQPAGPRQPGRSRHAGPAGADRRWRLPELRSAVAARALAVAAAAAVVAGGSYGAIQLAGGPTGASSAASASGSAAGVLPGAASFGPPQAYNSAGQPGEFTPVSTGAKFQPQLLKSQIRSELQRHSDTGSQATSPLPESTRLPARRSGPNDSAPAIRSFRGIPLTALRGCVTRIAAGRAVQLVDVDQYQGKPATIIVVAAPAGGSHIWVVGPGCSRSDSDVIARASLSGAG